MLLTSKVLSKLIKNKEKHNNLKIILFISAKLPCATFPDRITIGLRTITNAYVRRVFTMQIILTLFLQNLSALLSLLTFSNSMQRLSYGEKPHTSLTRSRTNLTCFLGCNKNTQFPKVNFCDLFSKTNSEKLNFLIYELC